MSPRGPLAGALMVLCWLGCNVEPYLLGGPREGDGGALLDDGGGVIDDSGIPGRPDAQAQCVPAAEVCDEIDNDCDGMTDEAFDLMQDPGNCGTCGNACTQTGAAGTCEQGTCRFACLTGYYDFDGDLDQGGGNGCEYGPCLVRNGGVEECNLADDDCDGVTDEGIDFDSDATNCGGCANVCQALNAEPLCMSGSCTRGECNPGYADVRPSIPGCEYTCPEYPPAAQESCDSVDNDCDGIVDELPISGLGDPCVAPGFESYGDTGACELGITECTFGVPQCVGYQGPTAEVCDEIDNDCDGVVDDGYDKLEDPRTCGGCTPCALDNAIAGCDLGSCTIVACQLGWSNADGDVSNGCEYACTPTGPEACDGMDNDCDTRVDEELTSPSNYCTQNGPCMGTQPTCSSCNGVTQWRCVYPDTAEVDGCGNLPVQESLCDQIDGDCDGGVDESQPLKGTACDDGGIGICQGTGTLICDPTDQTQVTCDITDPGATPMTGELCNDADDDCDGLVDEAAVDDVMMVDSGLLPIYWIDIYEAARPDATAAAVGSAEHRACSVPGVLPWRNITWTEAAAACAAAGKRLCTESEWELACAGPSQTLYPYGNTYEPYTCNGRDYDYDCTAPDDHDVLLPTGSAHGCPAPAASMCVSEYGVYDLSGNLKEWTSSEASPGSGTYRVRGGAHDNIASGLTCDFDFLSLQADYILPNLGFRCCSSTAP